MKKFTYYDYIYWNTKYYKEKNCDLQESSEEYVLSTKQTHHPYDKTFRMILNDKEEIAKFINKTLQLNKNKLKGNDIEKYATRFVTSDFENSESDIVYRKKNTNIFFLIEHQSKIDYSMPYRILTYNMEIIKSVIYERNFKEKNYKWPIVYPIVLYTGKRRWNVKQYFEECQEHLEECNERFFTYYNLVDINEFQEKELLEDNNLLSKILLLEKVDTSFLEENLIKMTEMNFKQKEKQMLSKIIYYNLSNRIGKEKATYYAKKILGKEETEMAAIDDCICRMIDKMLASKPGLMEELDEYAKSEAKKREENKIAAEKEGMEKGIKEGKKEAKTELIIEMLKNNLDEKTIKMITKISNKELGKIKEEAFCKQ